MLDWLAGQRLSYSVGFTVPADIADLVALIPTDVWAPAIDSNGQVRDGAWVAELTGLLDLTWWPQGMRVIVGKERPHPGAQLQITDADGMRLTAFATNTTTGQLANLPLHDFDQNRIWCALVTLACELTAWMQLLAFTGDHQHQARRWEPKRLRLRLFSAAARLAVTGRRTVVHLSRAGAWTGLLLAAITRLRALAVPG